MIVGVNRVFDHGGKQYHIQAEDLGVEQACFEVRVYDHGTVLWRKKVAYNDVLARGLPKIELEDELRGLSSGSGVGDGEPGVGARLRSRLEGA